ncbi:MAG TPA: HD domain-containing phosphohydrolase [Solirubrobacteraceae bacterium]|jgi:putative nucleotidyltransferase with HDIG domain
MHLPTARRLFWTAEALTLLGVSAATVLLSRPGEWHPATLVVMLLAIALVSERLEFEIRSQHLSASLVVLVLAMCLLGPAPAVVFGLAVTVPNSFVRRLSPTLWLNNLTAFAAFPLAGSLLVRTLVGDVHAAHTQHAMRSVEFGLIVFGVFMLTNALNFAVIAAEWQISKGLNFIRQTRELFLPMQPGQLALGALTAILAIAYTNLGLPALFGLIIVLGLFQYLIAALLRSEDRAEQLDARSRQLATLQLGVLSTLIETLALRDRTTARHAAAVARYARALALEVGASEEEQELTHTAGLLHDIGKFVLPDRILHAEILSDDDWSVIRRHPQDGATLVGRLDGYGPVADVILYHHERVDGAGYPAGLIGNEIPLASRIIAICSTFDTLTARDSYRSPMTPQDAIAELRRVAGRQLDSELVEKFAEMLRREGPEAFTDGDSANFAAELAFEKRVRQMAQPKQSA